MNLAARILVPESMDTDCRDEADYRACLHDLARVNTVTLTHRPILAWLRRETADLSSFSLLDVGCGGGDALRRIHRQAIAWGRRPELTGVDLHPWSIRAAQDATPDTQPIRYLNADVFAFSPAKPLDFIVSSQFTHHLTDDEIVRFTRWMNANATRGWFIADLRRHPFPYYGFPLLARLALWHRFVRHDGQISIGRGFVPADWHRLLARAGVPPGKALVETHFPFRMTVSRRCPPR
jgi:2-polyprenyl-3-methyl-5-hydroxy-6-metoxy-1,4-benzoquinol methylase